MHCTAASSGWCADDKTALEDSPNGKQSGPEFLGGNTGLPFYQIVCVHLSSWAWPAEPGTSLGGLGRGRPCKGLTACRIPNVEGWAAGRPLQVPLLQIGERTRLEGAGPRAEGLGLGSAGPGHTGPDADATSER